MLRKPLPNTCSYVPLFPTQAPCSGHRTQVGPRLPGTAASQAGSLPRNQPLPKEDIHRG